MAAAAGAVKIGIIGGTGLDDPDILEGRTEKYVDTPYGKPSDALILGKIKNVDCVLLARHGRHHTIMPSNINYRANIWALKEENCSHVLVTTACGSLREEIQPGDLVIIDQFIDRTTQRHCTLYDGQHSSLSGVCHVPMAEPFCAKTRETANGNLHTDDEHELREDKESYLCAVCLDVYFNPYMCYPCHHIFCEPCLRMLAKDNPATTPCPLCRTTIARVFFQRELNSSTRSFFPTEYLKLKENFLKSKSAKWPLPSCKKAYRVFEGFQRHSATVTRRHFPHAAHRIDYMDFEDDSRGWRLDMDMIIIYIYSVNWMSVFGSSKTANGGQAAGLLAVKT